MAASVRIHAAKPGCGKPANRFLLTLAALVLLSAPSPAEAQTRISADSLVYGLQTTLLPAYKLREGWRFNPGHDPSWAAPDYDDSAWQSVHAPFPASTGILPVEGWSGHGWFRLEVVLDDDVRHTPLALLFSALGAAEVYVDGRLVLNYGVVSTDPIGEVPRLTTDINPEVISIDPTGRRRILVAVRHSNHYDEDRPRIDYDHGFDIDIAPLADIVRRLGDVVRHRTVHSVFFAGVAATASLLHILLYIFNPASRQNLYYAMFAFLVALVAFLPTQLYAFTEDLALFTALDIVWKTSLASITLLELRFLYTAFDQQPPFYYRWLVGISTALVLASYQLPLSIYYSSGSHRVCRDTEDHDRSPGRPEGWRRHHRRRNRRPCSQFDTRHPDRAWILRFLLPLLLSLWLHGHDLRHVAPSCKRFHENAGRAQNSRR